MVAGARDSATDGDGPNITGGGRLVYEFRKRDGCFGRPGRFVVRGGDVPGWVPGRIAVQFVVRPAAAVDGEFIGRRIIAVDIELEGDAVEAGEISIALPSGVVGGIVDIFNLETVDGDVEKFVVVRDADLSQPLP